MKKVKIFAILLLFIFSLSLFTTNVYAEITGSELPKAHTPLLITNAGQGPGGKMGRLLVSRSEAVEDYYYLAEPKVEDLNEKEYKTLMVMIGSSAKGLGASGITIKEEIERLNNMIEEAKNKKMQILAVHIEGEARRGKPGSANEQSIDAIAPYADHIIVAKASNQDERFTDIAEENEIPLTILDQPMDLIEAVKIMYSE